MLFGLMSVFGNGVVEGWETKSETALSVSISEGFGNINFTAARTSLPVAVDLTPNSISYIYARTKERTNFAEDIDFIISSTQNITDPHFLLISKITTGPLSIETIDDSVRQEIGFIELIKAAIRQHKHRGGSLNPSKIDLQSEVQGLLPSFRIANFDAEKITTGTFDLSRIPTIDHQQLANVGILTHPQLDTFVKTLETNNKEFFGEIGTANLLQLIIGMKLLYDDTESAFYAGNQVDQNMINQLTIIPGITNANFLDIDNTTAEINTADHYIKGIPPSTGTSFYINYNTALAWNSAYFRENVITSGNYVTLAFNEDDTSKIVTIEGFESATSSGQNLSGASGGQSLFKKEVIVLSDNAQITANNTSTNVIEGFYSGKFTYQESFRIQFVKEYPTPQNWVTYDSFAVNVKCLDSIHGAVKIYFEDSKKNKTIDYILLDQDEITNNSDDNANNFELRVIDLTSITFRNDIKRIVIYTDDIINPFKFYVDFINLQRAILLPEEGILKIRYSSGTSLTFQSIDWTSSEPTGTELLIRTRSASGTAFLTRADYTPYLSNGDLINLEGTDLEIEVTLHPDSDRLIAPVLKTLRILVQTQADMEGFFINTYDEFSRGSETNITISSSPVSLSITSPISVNSYYFCLANTASQIYEETASGGTTFANSELSITATNTPIAPNQVFKAVEDGDNRVSLSRFFEPRSIRRQNGRNFIIADTYNDRVLEIDEDGELISGIGSINYEHNDKIFPISSCFDTRTGILYVVWSKKISFKTVNVSKIVLQTAGQQVNLVRDFDKIMGLTTSELETVSAEGQIMPVYLSLQNAGLVEQFSGSAFMLASSDTISTGLSTNSAFYRATVTALGIPMFIGKFAYISGILCPTFADKTDFNTLLISNSTIGIKEFTIPSGISETIRINKNVSSIIEVDENNSVIFGSNVIAFSPFIPGRVQRMDSNTILAGGIKPGGTEGSPTADAPLNFRSLSGTQDTKQLQKQTLDKIFFGGTTPFVGAAIVYDTQAKATTFEYISAKGMLVSDIDTDPTDGTYVLAESSFKKSGRVIKIDSAGNITFSYGEGLYSIINSLEVQVDGSIVIST